MGMEGKLRRVSEFELASYRRNPAKLYGEMLPFPAALSEAGKAISAMRNIQQSEVGRRIQERALSGQSPFPEDVEALQREMQESMKDFPQFSTAMQDGLPGLSKDKKRLNLHKSWDCLNYLLTGKVRQLDGSPLGKAILGGADIPERGYRKDYGPIRYLVPSEVQEVYSALENFPIDERTSRYDAGKAEMAKVYVPHHDAAELVEYFRALKEFYALAAENGEAVLLWIE